MENTNDKPIKMTMNQSGDLACQWTFYKNMLSFFRGGVACDFCSGATFVLERYVCDKRHDVKFDCIDINFPADMKVPSNVRKIILADVERKIHWEEAYDTAVCIEGIEHIDCTEMLLDNCYSCLKKGGIFMLAFPNLSSIFSRVELLFGFQPHILEISNGKGEANCGMGIFGKMNNPKGEPIHHIRGITYRGMKELLRRHSFEIILTRGSMKNLGILGKIFVLFPGLSADVLIIAKKI